MTTAAQGLKADFLSYNGSITKIIMNEGNDAQLADLIRGLLFELTDLTPEELINKLDDMKQKGIIAVSSEALSELRDFIEKDLAFKTASGKGERYSLLFNFAATPERLDRFHVSLTPQYNDVACG